MEIVFSVCLKHLKDKTSEDLHVAEKVSIVWAYVTLCLISAHIQIINMVMTLQLVVFLLPLNTRVLDVFLWFSHHHPHPLCPGH